MTVVGRPDLPEMNVGSPTEQARDTAETLLEAYYAQDMREAYLLQGHGDEARDAQERAIECMGSVYLIEFPELDTRRAERAGAMFMRALFLQDEIENWPMLLGAPHRDEIADLLQSDFTERYGRDGSFDRRWEEVESHLLETCRLTGIDESYADVQTQFWRLHGQLKEYWEDVAIEAHTIKLDAMIPEASADLAASLGEYFVAGVKAHDGWDHRDREREIAQLIALVASYYQKIFEVHGDVA